MAKINRTDLLDKAGRLVSKGELDGAVDLYLKLFQNDRSDWSIGNTLGDLYVRMGRSNEATTHFLSLAEQLSSDGFAAKARALYRKILRIQPDHRIARERLDDLERREAGSVSPFLKRVLETARAARETSAETEAPPPPAAAPTHRLMDSPEVMPPPAAVPTGPPIIQPTLAPPAPLSPQHAAGIPASTTEWADEWAAVLSQNPAPTPATAPAAPAPPAPRLVPSPLAAAAPPPPAVQLDFSDFNEIVAAAEASAARHDFKRAAATIEKFLAGQPQHIDALEKLIEVGVDGKLESVLISAQTRLAEACLDAGRLEQARNVAVDLAERHPDIPEHHELLERIVEPQKPAVSARPQVVPIAPPMAPGFISDEMTEEEAEIHLSLDHEIYADEPVAVPLDSESGAQEIVAEDPAFEEIRSALLEDAAAAAEERLSEATKLIEGKKYDEAVPALEDAMCAPHLRAIAGSKLAYVYRVRGLALEALECLEWVAALPPPTEESGHELAYQLALTLEAVGQEAQALGVYRELLAEVGPGFRDVAQRAERLAAA